MIPEDLINKIVRGCVTLEKTLSVYILENIFTIYTIHVCVYTVDEVSLRLVFAYYKNKKTNQNKIIEIFQWDLRRVCCTRVNNDCFLDEIGQSLFNYNAG